MPYEEIHGEIMAMATRDTGLQGSSVDFDGEHSRTISVRWIYPSGIQGIDWDEFTNEYQQIMTIAENTSLSEREKIVQINEIVYRRVSDLLHGKWDTFYGEHVNCITIDMGV